MSRHSPSTSTAAFWSGAARDSARDSRNIGGHEPPRPAKDGFEWVWFPDGYWAERPTARRDSSKRPGTISMGSSGKIFKWTSRMNERSPAQFQEREQRDLSPKTVQSTPPLSLPQLNVPKKNAESFSTPRALPHSPWLSEAAQVEALQRPADQQINFAGMITLNKQSPLARSKSSGAMSNASAFQARRKATKSRLPWKPFERSKIDEPAEVHQDLAKDPNVDAALSYFTQKPIDPSQPLTPLEEKEDDDHNSGPLKSLRRWLRKAPQNRQNMQSSTRTSRTSASSSNNHMWMEQNIPHSLAGGTAGCTKHHGKYIVPASDLSEEQALGATMSYPAGEAMSVAPPAIKQSAGGKPRSFFIDAKHPSSMNDSTPSSASSARTKAFSYPKGVEAERREWWDEPNALVRRDPVKGISFFEFDLPEHLPSSPTCPANPRHKLRGKGVCVVHGRSKQASVDDAAAVAEEEVTESL
ncbi:hypothetical protein N8I77_000546 [Diaporthe amygdali]|uniref:Uncharacterized protein n=1 Tax=Phomopsis amygdali TaxID=1214568 RepID=A0AAD9SP18_PHOAM|nr:hypothetical protein N8I77_000546 [Diaporthe amygdali]